MLPYVTIILAIKKGANFMKIGIDIDDVITDTYTSMTNYIKKYDTTGELMEHIEDVMKGDATLPIIEDFFANYMLEVIRNAQVKENASLVMQRLVENGHELFLITARGEAVKAFKGSESLTLDYLKENNIPYSKILFSCVNKAVPCKENHIDLMIDDSIKHCEAVQKEGIKSILFTSMVNTSLPTTVERVDNWLELEEKINNITNQVH